MFRVLELDPALGLRSAVSVVVMVLFTVVVASGDDIFQTLNCWDVGIWGSLNGFGGSNSSDVWIHCNCGIPELRHMSSVLIIDSNPKHKLCILVQRPSNGRERERERSASKNPNSSSSQPSHSQSSEANVRKSHWRENLAGGAVRHPIETTSKPHKTLKHPHKRRVPRP